MRLSAVPVPAGGGAASAVLITIPLSHYCEKARWGLDRAGLAYREQAHAPLLHRLATQRHDGGTVPVLVHGELRFTDSTAILVHADTACGGGVLYPRDPALRREADALEELFGTALGPHTRRWAYALLLPQAELLRAVWSRGVPRLEAGLVPVLTPLLRPLIRRTYRITPESAQRSLERVHGVFAQVEQHLRDGRRFLLGGRFSAADLGFAALAAPVLLPAECRAVQPALDDLPAGMQQEVLRLRRTDAGRFALRLFAEERGRSGPGVR